MVAFRLLRYSGCVAATVLLFHFTALADNWQSVGPGGGGHQRFAAISPHDPKLMFVACDMSGFYRSEDAGRSWRMHNRINTTWHAPVFHPTDPDVIYISTKHTRYEGMKILGGWTVWKSEDRGRTWQILYEHKYPYYSHTSVMAMLLDPDDPDRMWIGLSRGDPALVLRSSDEGRTWKASSTGLTARFGILKLCAGPKFAGARVLYARAGSAVFRSSDGGRNWTRLRNDPRTTFDLGVTVDQTKDGQTTLFVLGPPKGSGRQASNALRRSTDRGHTWTDLSTALIRAADSSGNGRIERMRRIATNQAQPDVLYLSADLRTASGGYRHGVFKSTDAGDSWTYLFPQPKSLDRIRDDRRKAKMPEYEPGWLPIEFSWGWGGNAMFLSTNQADPDQILWTDMGRTIGSKDGGTSWHGLYSNRGEDGYYGSRGLEVTMCYRVVFDPHHDQRMWISYTDIGNWRSDDRGKTWCYAMKGAKFRNTMYELVADPDIPDRLYGACSNTHDIPTFRYIAADPSKFTGGFCVSDDGGLNWQMRGEGLPNAAFTALVVDPKSDPKNRTLFAIAFAHGVYKSTDSGKIWTCQVSGMEDVLKQNENLVTLSIGPDGTLYAGITKRVRFPDGRPRTSHGGALFISDDGAESWRRIGPQLPEKLTGAKNDFSNIWDVATSPHDPNEVSVACCIDVHSRTNAPGGLYRSRDRGKTWERILGAARCFRVDYHPTDPDVLFCGTENSGLQWSRDRGATWKTDDELPFKSVMRAIVDPKDPNRVWVTTRGGGVWTGVLDDEP